MDTLRVTTDPADIDVEAVHRFLSAESYWARGVSLDLVRRSLRHSLCFAGFLGPLQVAFGRVVTDYSYFGYVRDVFVLRGYRRRGFAKILVRSMVADPRLAGGTLLLRTADAQGLYTQLGFTVLKNPEQYLRYSPNERSDER